MTAATSSPRAPGSSAPATLDDLWEEVIGQPELVDALRAAAESPVHAYLLVGPEGSGRRAAAAAFAAELLVRSAAEAAGGSPEAGEVERIVRLVGAGVHPALAFVERDGASISAEQARDVVRRASMAPAEGELQVFVLDEFHLVRDAAPILLKSIEEPPDSTVFIVLAEDVPDELVTIASRCVQLRTTAVPAAAIEQRLVAEGFDATVAAEAARSSGGSLRRARLLAGDEALVERRAAWRSVPRRLDGTGHTACVVADELLEGIESVLEPLVAAQGAELEAFDEVAEQTGVSRKGDRTKLESRHKREARRLRVDELRAGLAELLAAYRDDLSGSGDAEDARREPAPVERFTEAARHVQEMTDSLQFNPNEALALRALMLALEPPV